MLPEPPRTGEAGGRPCVRDEAPDEDVLWRDERWLLARFPEPLGVPFGAMLMPRAHLDLGDLDDRHAAELGVWTVRIDRAVRALGGIGRVHVNKWGDGGSHLHAVFLARPAGLWQLRGSCLPMWDDMLPRVPAEVADADLAAVAAALSEYAGEALVAPGHTVRAGRR